MEQVLNYIQGELVPPLSGQYLDNVDPATGKTYGVVPDSDQRDVDRAVDAARQAFPSWGNLSAADRFRVLMRMADLIEARLDPLARAECVDTGKPIRLARSLDIPRAAANFRFFASTILQSRSESYVTDTTALNYTLRKPRGVAGIISPWNLPLYLLTWKVAPALATGNTVVAKPSEVTPMTAFLLSQLCLEAGLPAGVLNIVHGLGPKVGAAIVAHPDVPTISFTGGTVTGREIARTASPMFKRVALELGGKNPNIIFADADLETALKESLRSSFANQGQVCLSGSRMFVQRAIFGEFVDRFVEATKAIRIGDPLEDSTEHGALVSRAQWDKVRFYVDLAKKEGGRVLCGGGAPLLLPARCRDGFFFEPTVISGTTPDCRVNQEEIFGPVVTVMPFESEGEVLAWANQTAYGLSASVWTADVSRAHRMAAALECGTVWVNCWLLRDLRVPFGGMKQSGVGREGGDEAIRFYTEPKIVCLRL